MRLAPLPAARSIDALRPARQIAGDLAPTVSTPSTNPTTNPPAAKVYTSRVVIAGLLVPAVLAVLLFTWWPRPTSTRQTAVPLPPGAGAAPGTRVLGVLELGAPLGWVHLGDYRNARWVTRNFSGWREGLPVVGTAISPLERAKVRGGAPDAQGRLASVTGHVAPTDTLAIVLLRVPNDGEGAVWARVASSR